MKEVLVLVSVSGDVGLDLARAPERPVAGVTG
jgi:hypothetical protein